MIDKETPVAAATATGAKVMKKFRLIQRKEAAAYLLNEWGITRTPKTLAKYATVGGGPPFRMDGKNALYKSADLDVYATSILSPLVNSTAELASLKIKGGRP
jgi:hypothetical protein